MELNVTETLQALQNAMAEVLTAVRALESRLIPAEAAPTDAAEGEVAKITASVEGGTGSLAQHSVALALEERAAGVEQRLKAAESALASLEASSNTTKSLGVRKTLPVATVQLLAKQGIEGGDIVDVKSLDAALAGLSVEHRIAVKSQMLRTGTLTP
ncbi:hypothetical protein [Acidipila sp. EB88]|uniref:hypothetical protein n=1 Tax=Acidipila sp. EB88 TaxID=2305226 RepID=UPI000F5F393D|nr:hypothetical protein [Acidipila sp. EB88]RRA48224.1 hypothetical protein D1Y84_07915 [Acidipila sp. EB88]